MDRIELFILILSPNVFCEVGDTAVRVDGTPVFVDPEPLFETFTFDEDALLDPRVSEP